MRIDIREQTIRIAEAELRENGCYITLVSKAIVDRLDGDWSPPFSLMFETQGGIAEIILREQAANGEDAKATEGKGA